MAALEADQAVELRVEVAQGREEREAAVPAVAMVAAAMARGSHPSRRS